jgi:hypothetical protein
MRNMLYAGAAALALFASTQTQAAEFGSFSDKHWRSWIAITGKIQPGDDAKLHALLQDRYRHHRKTVYIALDSPGGNVMSALEIADTLYKNGINTAVGPNAMCASACFYLFAAGPKRIFSAQAQIGVHSIGIAGNAGGDGPQIETEGTASMDAIIARMFHEMGVPDGITGKMVATPPEGMAWLKSYDLEPWATCADRPGGGIY